MTPRFCTLGKDRLLTGSEAVEAIKAKTSEYPKMDETLSKLAAEDRVKVWLCSDGELRFQYNPYPNGEQQRASTANKPS